MSLAGSFAWGFSVKEREAVARPMSVLVGAKALGELHLNCSYLALPDTPTLFPPFSRDSAVCVGAILHTSLTSSMAYSGPFPMNSLSPQIMPRCLCCCSLWRLGHWDKAEMV